MPDKKGFLQHFTFVFWGMILLGLVALFIFVAYYFFILSNKLDSPQKTSTRDSAISNNQKLVTDYSDENFIFRLIIDSTKVAHDEIYGDSVRLIQVIRKSDNKIIQEIN